VRRPVKWFTRAQIGPRWRAGELFEARWGGGAGALDTTGLTRQRGSRARNVLGGLTGCGSGEVELFAWARGCGAWRLVRAAAVPEDLAHGDWVCDLCDEAAWTALVKGR